MGRHPDAADNAAEAFQREREYTNEPCFLPYLWKISLPDNARLIMTCRSHRKHFLNFPDDVIDVELKGFSKDNSLGYLQTVYPACENAIFHYRGIRSQS